MRTLVILLVALAAVGLPLRAADPAVNFHQMTLREGTTVTGDLVVRPAGVYQQTAVGGKLYAWTVITPASLPADVQAARRGTVLQWLTEAQARYDRQDFAGARTRFAQVYQERDYLTAADQQLPACQDLAQKAAGNVRDGDHWVAPAQYQAARGLVWTDGTWRTISDAEQLAAFKRAFADARLADTPEEAIAALKQVMTQYPASPYLAAARQRCDQLAARAAPPPDDAGAPQYLPGLTAFRVERSRNVGLELTATKTGLPIYSHDLDSHAVINGVNVTIPFAMPTYTEQTITTNAVLGSGWVASGASSRR